VGRLAQSGALLSATCSIEHAENGAQVRRLVNRHALVPVLDRTIAPACLPGEPLTRYRDGGFHALLVKS
jgi:16S rRNA C967 or C1407 C5-methylase (RsmB/RsmF family)